MFLATRADPAVQDALIILQLFVVLFLALHDWVPLGTLNNLAAVQAADSPARLVAVTALSTLPFAVGFAGSVATAGRPAPEWLTWWLWISYLAVGYGALRAWWLPYLLFEEPARIERYRARFAGTHAFLPMRHGIRPDTLHVTLHLVLIAILMLLGVQSFTSHGAASS